MRFFFLKSELSASFFLPVRKNFMKTDCTILYVNFITSWITMRFIFKQLSWAPVPRSARQNILGERGNVYLLDLLPQKLHDEEEDGQWDTRNQNPKRALGFTQIQIFWKGLLHLYELFIIIKKQEHSYKEKISRFNKWLSDLRTFTHFQILSFSLPLLNNHQKLLGFFPRQKRSVSLNLLRKNLLWSADVVMLQRTARFEAM